MAKRRRITVVGDVTGRYPTVGEGYALSRPTFRELRAGDFLMVTIESVEDIEEPPTAEERAERAEKALRYLLCSAAVGHWTLDAIQYVVDQHKVRL